MKKYLDLGLLESTVNPESFDTPHACDELGMSTFDMLGTEITSHFIVVNAADEAPKILFKN